MWPAVSAGVAPLFRQCLTIPGELLGPTMYIGVALGLGWLSPRRCSELDHRESDGQQGGAAGLHESVRLVTVIVTNSTVSATIAGMVNVEATELGVARDGRGAFGQVVTRQVRSTHPLTASRQRLSFEGR